MKLRRWEGKDLPALYDSPPKGKKSKSKPKVPVFGAPLPPFPPDAEPGEFRVFTDGGCWPNPGRGGWAWVVEGETDHYGSGFAESTTNQRMELTAALEAVKNFDRPLTIVSDSRYVVDCFNQKWWVKWEKNSWMRGNPPEPVKNSDLWMPLVALVKARGDVKFVWVKGHVGQVWNERADELAAEAVYVRTDAMPEHLHEDPPPGVDPEDLIPMALTLW